MGQIKNLNAFQRYVQKQEWANLLTLVFLGAFLLIGTGVTTYVHYQGKYSEEVQQMDIELYGIQIDSLQSEIDSMRDSHRDEIVKIKEQVDNQREIISSTQGDNQDMSSLIDSLRNEVEIGSKRPKSLTIRKRSIYPSNYRRFSPTELKKTFNIQQLIFEDEDTGVEIITLEHNVGLVEARGFERFVYSKLGSDNKMSVRKNTKIPKGTYVLKYPTTTIL
ncbi:hypothetical protein [Portibacter marinus]|uniref:hypothetical protein n=1 Tax=Portibacter marinus TaxID=2898660 RepID=UPI001F35C88A|nr:hypothetical protein [Portibacter marinus]